MSEISMQSGLRTIPVIEDVSVVIVRTMKRKYVDQLPNYDKDIPAGLVVLGTICKGAIVVAKAPNGQLCRVHCTDFRTYLVGDKRSKETYEDASRTIANYPQIFED